MKLEQGQWKIEDTPEGFQLHYRCRMSLLEYAPSSLRPHSRLPFFVMLFLTPAVLLAIEMAFGMPSALLWLIPVTVFLTLLLHWFTGRLALSHGYFYAVKARMVEFDSGKVDLPEGQFDQAHLESLRSDIVRGRDRYTLVFDGQHEKRFHLVCWPGFDAPTIGAISAAVLARTLGERALTSASS